MNCYKKIQIVAEKKPSSFTGTELFRHIVEHATSLVMIS